MAKKLDGYEATPPDGLWDRINKALEERCLSVSSSRGRRTVWLRLAGIAAALAIVVPLGRNVCRPVFTSLVEKRIQTEDILPEPSDVFWAKVRRVKKESYRGKPFGKDTVTFCDRSHRIRGRSGDFNGGEERTCSRKGKNGF